MTTSPGPPERIGEVLDGKYRITRIIGQGGMGAVYAGEHVRVKRAVAIKILHAGANGVGEMAERFEREAQAAGKIGSDHIVEVYDLGVTPAGERFMVMEYLEGEPLRTRIKRQGRLTPGEIVGFFAQLLEGLAGAHAAGIIHRDLKPDNVFLVKEKAGRRDFVKLLDFGISKFTHMEDGAMTRTGVVMGSPNYMSPEHVKTSSEVDARSDLYSVGVMLFEAASGQVPRRAANFAELLFKVVYEPVPDLRTLVPDAPPALAAIIERACAADPAQRFQTAQEFRAALEALGRELEQRLAEAGTGRFVDETSGASTVALSAAGLGPGFSSGVHGPGASSQPAFGASSQPAFGASSQPGLKPAPPPPFGAGSQPSFGAGSQPSFAAGSQPSYAGVAQATVGPAAQVAPPPRASRGLGALAIAGAAVVGVALSLGVAFFVVGKAPGDAAAPGGSAATAPTPGPTAAPTTTARPSTSGDPSAAPDDAAAEPSAEPSAQPSAEPVAAGGAARPSPVRVPRTGPATKPPATAKPAATPASKPAEPDLGY